MPPGKARLISTPSPALAKAHVVQMSIMPQLQELELTTTKRHSPRETPSRRCSGHDAQEGAQSPRASILQLLLLLY